MTINTRINDLAAHIGDAFQELNTFVGNSAIRVFANRAAALAATIPEEVSQITVRGLGYVRDAAGTALTTADGKKWSPVGVIYPEHFGAVGDGVADDTSALAAAFAAGGALSGKGVYRITSKVTISTGVKATALKITWGGAEEGTMLGLGHPSASLTGCTIDGQNAAAFGVVASAGEINRCEVKELQSSVASAIGIQITGTVHPVRCFGNSIHHIHSDGDSSVGNVNGASRGIQIYVTADIQRPHTVEDNSIWQITGEEGDGIHLLAIDGNGFKSAGGTKIIGNTVWDCSKRCIKTQGDDTLVERNTVRLSIVGGYSAIDSIDGANTRIRNNTVTSEITGGRGIQMVGYVATSPRLSGGSVVGNTIKTMAGEAGISLNVRVIDDVEISGNTLLHGRFVTDTSARLKVRGNIARDTVASGADGGFSFRNSTTGCDIEDNTATGGDPYTCVRVAASGNKITGNRNNSTVQADASAVFVTAGGNTLIGNINAKVSVPVIRYGGTATGAGQILVANNVQMAP